MVLTGGYHTLKKAHRYNENGFLEALPNLNKESVFHSCASYINNEDKRVNILSNRWTYIRTELLAELLPELKIIFRFTW